ncbi:MAG: HU family DNA-binding protein [SAR324 cluster bacterium]|nr:HU family DNA-binding protein [SAR324 cluster bacterium]
MTKAELIAEIAQETGRTKVDAELFLNATLGVIESTLSKGESIPLIGFGTFSVSKRSARKGRNPQTGQEISIPASNTVKFSVGSKLKAAVN